jgi:uncharacterized protein (TIGR03083 family)
MNAPPDLATVALRELGVITTIVDDIAEPDYTRPTALPGWTIEHLVRHVTSIALRQAESFHRARFTIAEAPTNATITAPIERLPATLRSVRAHCASGIASLDAADEPIVPLPYASLPASLAGYVLLVEYGVHRYDIEQATTGTGVLASDVGEVITDHLGLTLPALAAPIEPPTHTIRFEPHDRSPTTLAWRCGRWASTDNDAQTTCVVRGPADALALLVAGRIATTDDRLTIEDPTNALAHLKTMFPGP